MATYKLLLIDDDTEMTDLLSEYLQAEGYLVDIAHDGRTGLDKASSGEFDLILLDGMLPVLDGFEVLKRFRQKHLTPVLMLTARGDDFDRIFGLELGADDYLPKPFNHRELVARIKAITRRIEFLTQTTDNRDLVNHVEVNHAVREVTCHGADVEVTGTEFQLLNELMNRAGEIVSKEQLSESVLGRRLAPFDRSIDMHVSNLRKKLQKDSGENKIKTVRGAGYVFLKGNE